MPITLLPRTINTCCYFCGNTNINSAFNKILGSTTNAFLAVFNGTFYWQHNACFLHGFQWHILLLFLNIYHMGSYKLEEGNPYFHRNGHIHKPRDSCGHLVNPKKYRFYYNLLESLDFTLKFSEKLKKCIFG